MNNLEPIYIIEAMIEKAARAICRISAERGNALRIVGPVDVDDAVENGWRVYRNDARVALEAAGFMIANIAYENSAKIIDEHAQPFTYAEPTVACAMAARKIRAHIRGN